MITCISIILQNTSSLNTISKDNSYTICPTEIQEIHKLLGHLDHNTFLKKLLNNLYNLIEWKYKCLS